MEYTTSFSDFSLVVPFGDSPHVAVDLLAIVNGGDGKGSYFQARHFDEETHVSIGAVTLMIKGSKAREYIRDKIRKNHMMGLEPEAYLSVVNLQRRDG